MSSNFNDYAGSRWNGRSRGLRYRGVPKRNLKIQKGDLEMQNIEIDQRNFIHRQPLAHGDDINPERRRYNTMGLTLQAEAIRHTRGSWAGGW